MSDSLLSLIWSKYIHSPELGMHTLHDTCVALINQPLSSTNLVPALTGFTLHPHLTEPLHEVLPILKHLLYAAATHRSSSHPLFDYNHTDFWLATILGVPQEDVMPAWARLMHKLARAMHCLEYICSGAPLHDSAPSETARRAGGYAPQREVPSRQAGSAIEEVLDAGACRAKTILVDVHIPAKGLVTEKGKPVGMHGTTAAGAQGINLRTSSSPPSSTPSTSSCTDSAVSWHSTTSLASSLPPSTSSATTSASWRSTCVTLPASTASSWRSKAASSLRNDGPREDTTKDSWGAMGSLALWVAIDKRHINSGISEGGLGTNEGHTESADLKGHVALALCPRTSRYHPHVDVCVVCALREWDLIALARPAVLAQEKLRREQRQAAALQKYHISTSTREREVVHAPHLLPAKACDSRFVHAPLARANSCVSIDVSATSGPDKLRSCALESGRGSLITSVVAVSQNIPVLADTVSGSKVGANAVLAPLSADAKALALPTKALAAKRGVVDITLPEPKFAAVPSIKVQEICSCDSEGIAKVCRAVPALAMDLVNEALAVAPAAISLRKKIYISVSRSAERDHHTFAASSPWNGGAKVIHNMAAACAKSRAVVEDGGLKAPVQRGTCWSSTSKGTVDTRHMEGVNIKSNTRALSLAARDAPELPPSATAHAVNLQGHPTIMLMIEEHIAEVESGGLEGRHWRVQ
ncbi:hypothetical protein B0H13DRAFT_1895045 [Mycena leptocephala]|nr:hypothetical protein B0H13DRAFT_1895045 [Mycena leptocephala]